MALGQFVVSTSTPPMQQGSALTMKQMLVPLVKLESIIRVAQRIMKRKNDAKRDACQVVGKKPHKIKIHEKGGGGANGRCDGKNVWMKQWRP